MHRRGLLGEIWSPWEEVVALQKAWYRVPCLAAVLMAAWWAPASSRTAPSDPTPALTRLAVRPPAGIRFAGGTVTAWTSFAAGGSARSLRRYAATALRRAGALGPKRPSGGRVGQLRWYRYETPDTTVTAAFTPPAAALKTQGTVSLVVTVKTGPGPALTVQAQRLVRALCPWGQAHVAATLRGQSQSALSPLDLAVAVLAGLGASNVERVGGPEAADAFGRMHGAQTVSVAGRAFNVEVSVGRSRRGLLVDIGTPLLPPPQAAEPGA